MFVQKHITFIYTLNTVVFNSICIRIHSQSFLQTEKKHVMLEMTTVQGRIYKLT